jgi:competence ComEA-like helix-hairpin-helix protein
LVVWREWVAVCGVTGLVLVLWLVRWLWMADSLLDVDSTSERARVGRLDLNRATEGELVRLPGVGGGLAARIVQHRVQAGNFRTLEQLTEVAGIGPQRLQQFRAYCFVAGEVESSDRKVVPENRRTVSVAGTVSTRR